MAVNSAAQLDALFKEYHEQVVVQQFPQATPFYSSIKDAGKEWRVTQKGWSANAYLRQEASNVWGQPGLAFPAGQTFIDKRFHVYRAKWAKAHEIDGSTYNDLRAGNEIALINQMEIQRRLMLDAAQEMEQACTGDGTGKKAVIDSASTTVLTLKSTPNGTHASGFGADLLIEEGVYDILTSAGAEADASHADVTFPVGSISRSANTVTLTSALGAAPAASSFIVYANSYNQYPEGLRSLIDGGRTTEFQGIDAASEPYLNSAKIDAGGNEISPTRVQNLIVKHTYFNGGEPLGNLEALTSPTQLAIYTNGGFNLVRYGANDNTFKQGFAGAEYGGIRFQALVTLDPDVFTLMDKSDVRRLVGKPLGLHNEDGLTWRQKQAGANLGYDVWYILYGYEGNLALMTPRKHAIMTNLSTTGFSTAGTRFATS